MARSSDTIIATYQITMSHITQYSIHLLTCTESNHKYLPTKPQVSSYQTTLSHMTR